MLATVQNIRPEQAEFKPEYHVAIAFNPRARAGGFRRAEDDLAALRCVPMQERQMFIDTGRIRTHFANLAMPYGLLCFTVPEGLYPVTVAQVVFFNLRDAHRSLIGLDAGYQRQSDGSVNTFFGCRTPRRRSQREARPT